MSRVGYSCLWNAHIYFPAEVKWIGMEVKINNGNKVTEVGLYYTIQGTPSNPLTALSFASNYQEEDLIVDGPIATLQVQSLVQTPSSLDPSLVIKYSIESLSGAGSPLITLVS